MNFLRNVWRWCTIHLLDRCDCGGRWIYQGEYGFGEVYIVEQCDTCYTQRTFHVDD